MYQDSRLRLSREFSLYLGSDVGWVESDIRFLIFGLILRIESFLFHSTAISARKYKDEWVNGTYMLRWLWISKIDRVDFQHG